MRTTSRFHAATWLAWALGAAATVQLAPSPVYVVPVIAIAALTVEVHRLDTVMARAFPLLVGVGIAFAALRVVLTALTTHGIGPALFTLPQLTLPRVLGGFAVGGTIEAVVILQAAAEGVTVVGLMAAFGAFNSVASHHELLQRVPRAFHEPGLAVAVGIAFVPSTVRAVQETREADLARTGGVPVRRGRVVRQMLPILDTGMARSVHLAESMDSRGFGRDGGHRVERAGGWLGLLAVLALAGGFVALVGRNNPVALGLGVTGAVALAAAIVVVSRASHLTRYRPRRFTAADGTIAVSMLAVPMLVAVAAELTGAETAWVVLDPPSFPAVAPAVLGLVVLLAVPALLPPRDDRRDDPRRGTEMSLEADPAAVRAEP